MTHAQKVISHERNCGCEVGHVFICAACWRWKPVKATPVLSRDVLRSRRKRSVRSHTLPSKRTPRRDIERMRAQSDADLEAAGDFFSPTTRGDCERVSRPCPHVSCRWHLYLDVNPRNGAVKLNFPDIEVSDMDAEVSCALDVADRGGLNLEETGRVMNLTRERIQQIEVIAKAKVGPLLGALLNDGEARDTHRRLPVLPDGERIDVTEGLDIGGEQLFDRAER